jgi:two-component system chemotaxis response regulator CheY
MQKILLIEPDAALARTYMQALQHAGFAPTHVSNAQDAIDAADHTTPDAVILELQLAVHDGVEFLHELRSHAEWQSIPVIINTNLTPQALAPVQGALAGDLGVVEVLYKPRTSLQQLISSVRQGAPA